MSVSRKFAAAVLCLAALAGGGCRKRGAQAAAPVVIFPPTPEVPVPDPSTLPAEKPAPEVKEPPKPLPEIVPPPKSPPRPAARPAPSQPDNSSATDPAATKPAPPRMTPGLSPELQAQYQKEALDGIALAERNLKLAAGKNLNATQRDLREKVQGFLAQAQDARNEGDWARARNLADKARLLSIELVNSL